MAYTTIDDPSAHFQTLLWTGNDSNRSLTNTGNSNLQPDLVWFKCRSSAYSHALFDSSRGVNKYLTTTETDAELTNPSSGYLASFDSDGFSAVGGSSASNPYNNWNRASDTYVAWQWKANGGTTTTNDASATSVGTIDSVYQADTTARFSIVTYSGTGSAGTIAHGLGVTPNVIIIKNRGSSTRGWIVYHDKSHATPEENFTLLNTTAAVADLDRMNDTAPTSTVFSVSDDTHVNNGSDTYVAYCFANIQGYSRFGSFTGNGNDNGPFIYTGFKPALVIVKRTNNSGAWHMYSSSATGIHKYNEITTRLEIDDASAAKEHVYYQLDFLSNGFKFWEEGDNINGSGDTMIYCAWAEFPFVSSDGVPATAV